MQGCRPFTDAEIQELTDYLIDKDDLRTLALLWTGIRTGFRISELLSLKRSSVYDAHSNAYLPKIAVERRHMKGQLQGRTVPMHPQIKGKLSLWVPKCSSEGALFPSRKGGAITRRQAWNVFKTACEVCGIKGSIATHTMRKTFAIWAYELLNHDIVLLQTVMGHCRVDSTRRYLPWEEDAAWAVLLQNQ